MLERLDGNHDQLITTSQVEMEFKKNRQKVIRDEALNAFKAPQWSTLNLPAFISESQPAASLEKARTKIDQQSSKVKARIERVLKNPTQNDPVYKIAQRLFKAHSACHLYRTRKERFQIRRLARKRFLLGYPPKKATDTSYGDAINWEWIVHTAAGCKDDIVIVSRDEDYGTRYGKEMVVNDWLGQEFRERVSKKRKLVLTDRLSAGFKLAEIAVSAEEEEEEERQIEELAQAQSPDAEEEP